MTPTKVEDSIPGENANPFLAEQNLCNKQNHRIRELEATNRILKKSEESLKLKQSSSKARSAVISELKAENEELEKSNRKSKQETPGFKEREKTITALKAENAELKSFQTKLKEKLYEVKQREKTTRELLAQKHDLQIAKLMFEISKLKDQGQGLKIEHARELSRIKEEARAMDLTVKISPAKVVDYRLELAESEEAREQLVADIKKLLNENLQLESEIGSERRAKEKAIKEKEAADMEKEKSHKASEYRDAALEHAYGIFCAFSEASGEMWKTSTAMATCLQKGEGLPPVPDFVSKELVDTTEEEIVVESGNNRKRNRTED